MKILVIGGTGLISSALVRRLALDSHQVTVYNRGETEGNLPRGVSVLRGDRYNRTQFADDIRRAGVFDCIYDMITFTREQAEELLLAVAGKTGQLIVCSTVDVYEKPPRSYPTTEATPLCGLGNYAAGKVEMERALGQSSVPVTILRPCHVYGPGGSTRGHLIHSLGKGTFVLDRIRKGLPVVIHGDGSSLWSACYSTDAGEGFALAAGNTKSFGKAYHIAPNEWITWRDYYSSIATALDSPAPKFKCIPTNDLAAIAPEMAQISVEHLQFNTIFDNTAAREDLGFEAETSFAEGVRTTVRWVESTYGFEDAESNAAYNAISVRR